MIEPRGPFFLESCSDLEIVHGRLVIIGHLVFCTEHCTGPHFSMFSFSAFLILCFSLVHSQNKKLESKKISS